MSRRLARALACVALLVFPVGSAGALTPPAEPVTGPPPAHWPRPSGLDAQAYVLVEAATGQVLAGHDGEVQRPVASTIKVLTALTVLERADPDDEVTVGEEVLTVAGAGVGLSPGDIWSVDELLDALVARSGNDAAEALAVHVAGDRAAFARLMAADAAALGIESRTIVSPSGLDDDNRLSALDLATVARAALAHPQLREVLGRPQVALPGLGLVESRNELLTSYPDATGVKTGYTVAAGNSLVASARRDGRELVAVVLGSGEDPARFEAAAALLDLGFDAYEPRELGARLDYLVAGGSVGVEVPRLEVTVPAGESAHLVLQLAARPPEAAPPVPVRVGDDVLGEAGARLDTAAAPGPVEGDAAVGRAAVDGVYAALRAAAAGDVLR